MAGIGLLHGVKVRVKNSFLEFVADGQEEVQPKIEKYYTDSVLQSGQQLAMGSPSAASEPPLRSQAARGLERPSLAPGSRSPEQARSGPPTHSSSSACAPGAPMPTQVAPAVAGQLQWVQPLVDGQLQWAVPPYSMPVLLGVVHVQGTPACGFAAGAERAAVVEAEVEAREEAGALEAEEQDSDSSNTGRSGIAEPESASEAPQIGDPPLTTVMLRNLPNDYTREMLLDLLDAFGFGGLYDFLYLPIDLQRKAGLGYAFVNLVSPAAAQLVRQRLEGFRQWSVPSGKVCSVGWSIPCQGLEANVERYRNSPIMHSSVPDEYKPIVLVDGKRCPFPRPTKKLRKPDMGFQGRRRTR